MLRIVLLSLTVVFFSGNLLSQKGATVRGFLTDVADGAVVPYTYVVLRDTVTNTTFADQTDDKGFYQISRITPGAYRLEVVNAEFTKFTRNIVLKEGDIETIDIRLEKTDEVLGAVDIYGQL